jgi:sugar O-acyltransferase (sialic acid O-acetyltransferase NeuD family)
MTRPLVILGTGGSAYDVLDIIGSLNAQSPTWEVAGFLDDARPPGSRYLDLPILGALKDASRFPECSFINVIGSETSYRRRAEIVQSTGLAPERFATLVHPKASVSPWARLGRGVYVSFGASVGGGVVTGDHVSFSPGCIIGHDSVISDCALIAPGAVISGFVRVGRSCYIGAGAMIRQRVRIADGALVGIGAVVIRDVAAEATVVGNPARLLVRAGAG